MGEQEPVQIAPQNGDAKADQAGSRKFAVSLKKQAVFSDIFHVNQIIVLQGIKFVVRQGVNVVCMEKAVKPDDRSQQAQYVQLQEAG